MSSSAKPIARQPSRKQKSLKSKTVAQAEPRSSARLTIFFCLGLALITIAVYCQVAWHPFVNYDDEPYVTGNPHVKAGLTWDTFSWAL